MDEAPKLGVVEVAEMGEGRSSLGSAGIDKGNNDAVGEEAGADQCPTLGNGNEDDAGRRHVFGDGGCGDGIQTLRNDDSSVNSLGRSALDYRVLCV